MSFPISPANNQTALVNGIVYQWNESLGVWKRNGSVDSITVGQLILNSGTESTSNTTGTIIVSGGAGITGNLHTSNIYISGTGKGITFPDGTIQTTAGVAVDSYARTTANAATALAQAAFDSANVIVGVNTTQNTNITSVNQYAAGAYATANGANGLAAGAYVQANTNAGDISIIQGVDLTQNTNITNATTLAQSAYNNSNTKFSSSGGTVTGSVTITNDLTVNGNVSFVGNVTSVTVSGNTGQFFGYAANGFNALYAGIPIGYNIEPQAVFTLSSDFDGYSAINMQNINSGSNSSSDLFLIADNGSDFDGFLNLGLGGSNYSYEGYTLIGPNDGYLFASGNTSTGGGDLILASQLNNDVIFAVNGLNTENEVMRITSANNLVIKSTNASTSKTTGALQVAGGVGVEGDIQASGVYSNGMNVVSHFQGVDNTQNTNITSVNQYAASGYALANTNAGLISIIQGVDLGQNATITAVNDYAAGAYSLANTKFSSSGGTITGNVTITETLTVSGNITANIISTGSGSSVVSVNSNTFTTSSTSEVSVDSFPSTLYRSAKYQAQMTSGSAYHAIELLLIHDGTTVSLVQYGEVMTGASLGTFNASITGSTLNLLFTATNNVTTVNLFRTSLVV